MKLLYSFLILVKFLTFSADTLYGSEKGIVVFIRVGAAKTEQFKDYMDIAHTHGYASKHFHVTINPLRANHIRDYRNLNKLIAKLSKKYQSIYAFGYSIGGKFAARLARDNPHLEGAFLLDPVDGGPPILPRSWNHLPVFFQESSNPIFKPTWVIETELAQTPGQQMGFRCVNQDLGAQHFMRYIAPSKVNFLYIEDAGHLQLVLPPKFDPPGSPGQDACPAGNRSIDSIMSESFDFWEKYLAKNAKDD